MCYSFVTHFIPPYFFSVFAGDSFNITVIAVVIGICGGSHSIYIISYFRKIFKHVIYEFIGNSCKKVSGSRVSEPLNGKYFSLVFYYFALAPRLRWISFTSSTTGITQKPRPRAITYSSIPTEVNPNAAAMKGISQTKVVRTSEPIAAR